MFITLEGCDGSGKTTQARLLAEFLRGQGLDVILTREPGGTAIGDQLRAIVHDPANTAIRPPVEAMLYSAARGQLVEEVIKPQLARGGVVLCDRYADSTLAYQGYGRGLDLAALRVITAFVTGGLKPDLTLYLDIDAEEGLRRRQASGGEWNRMDQLALEFHQRVRAGYQALIAEEPARWLPFDARAPIGELQEQLRAAVWERMKAASGKSSNER